MKPISLGEQLVDNIRQDILNGVYQEDSPLRQDALASKYGVSRIPVREALLQLEAEGLVTVIPRKGAVVTPLSRTEVDDVLALRLLLEPRLYRASAPHLNKDAIKAAHEALASYRAAIQAQERARYGILNVALHQALYVEANMPRTSQIVANLLQTSERYTRVQLSTNTAMQTSVGEHEQLLALTESGQYEEAETLLKAHIQHVWEDLQITLSK